MSFSLISSRMRTHAYLIHITTNFRKIILDFFRKKTPYCNFFTIFPLKNTVFYEKSLFFQKTFIFYHKKLIFLKLLSHQILNLFENTYYCSITVFLFYRFHSFFSFYRFLLLTLFFFTVAVHFTQTAQPAPCLFCTLYYTVAVKYNQTYLTVPPFISSSLLFNRSR